MLNLKELLTEATSEDKLTHLEHAEDHVLNAGAAGYDHAHKTLTSVHNALQGKSSNVSISTKYDGSPSIVFGRHPENGKFFVASKSAFNKNPKINYSDKDIQDNHGHAPGLVEKLKAALKHLPKVTPSKGVFQGDVMHSGVKSKDNPHGDVTLSKGQAHFTPNTITYSTHKPGESDDVKDSKFGVAVHTSYSGDSFDKMKAKYNSNAEGFSHHPDVHMVDTTHETSKTKYKPEHAAEFEQHMKKAAALHKKLSKGGYDAAESHTDHLKTYINKTVRTGEKPSAGGYKDHVTLHHTKAADKLKTEAGKGKILSAGKELTSHVDSNSNHFDNLLQLHHHLQSAKNVLAGALSSHTSHAHSINGVETKPEGHVAVINNRPTKIVDREEFSRANFAKARA